MLLRAAAAAIVMAIIVQGCATSPKTCSCNSYKELTVRVTQDQQFEYKGSLLTVEEFFEQAEYAKGSNMVTLDVAQESEIARTTIIRAIAFLQGRGYSVAMSAESKYGDLIP